jgi:hypothetical protein
MTLADGEMQMVAAAEVPHANALNDLPVRHPRLAPLSAQAFPG